CDWTDFMVRPYEEQLRQSFEAMLGEAAEFFMGRGDIRSTMRRLAERLTAEGIHYAVVGGMALGGQGYVRMTEVGGVLVTGQGLGEFIGQWVGRGYRATHPGAQRAFRDTETGVRIEFLVTGEYPGDGNPKPVSFPDPAQSSVEVDGIRVVTLPRLVELKLAS